MRRWGSEGMNGNSFGVTSIFEGMSGNSFGVTVHSKGMRDKDDRLECGEVYIERTPRSDSYVKTYLFTICTVFACSVFSILFYLSYVFDVDVVVRIEKEGTYTIPIYRIMIVLFSLTVLYLIYYKLRSRKVSVD